MTAVTEQTNKEAEILAPLEDSEWIVRDDSWKSETRLEMLAWELARYETELTHQLVEAGIRRFQRS